MRSEVKGSFDGRRRGNLVDSESGALWILPPQRIMKRVVKVQAKLSY